MSSQAKTPGFTPVHGGHAVEQAIVAVRFGTELADLDLSDLRGSMGILNELPKRSTLTGFTVAVGPGALAHRPGQIEAPLGIAYSRHDASGELEAELQLERGAITYRTTRYPGWANLIGFLREQVLARALPTYLKLAPITSYLVAYTDKFVCDPLDLTSSAFDVLRPNSRYICPYIYGLPDYWHSHSGAFERIDSRTKRLVNVNVDYRPERTEDAVRRAIVAVVALTDILTDVVAVSDVSRELELIATRLDGMHTDAKRLVGDVIADDMINRIALHG